MKTFPLLSFVLFFGALACGPKPSGLTYGQMADQGREIFAQRCAKCHGEQGRGGQGPALMGPDAHLEKFNTTQGLISFVEAAMPMDDPGSLSGEEYWKVVSYLITQNGLVSRDIPFDAGKMEDTRLVK
ncbi:MAG: cytochrome c [Chloroflexi bacterium]|nr:cytochrome c [Chloroflexota bacterium]